MESDLSIQDFQGGHTVLWALEVPLGHLAPGTLCPHCPHHLLVLEGSDLDPQCHQDTLRHQTKVRSHPV